MEHSDEHLAAVFRFAWALAGDEAAAVDLAQRELDALLSGKMCELPVPAALDAALAHYGSTAP